MKFAFFVFFVVTVANIYTASSWRLRFPPGIAISAAVFGLFFFLWALQIVAPVLTHFYHLSDSGLDTPFFRGLAYLSYVVLGICGAMFVITAAFDVLWFLARTSSGFQIGKAAGYVTLAGILITTALAGGMALYHGGRLELVRVTMPVRHLPAAFDGVTIAQISDVHLGPFLGRDFSQTIVDMVIAAKPDMIVITGDLADDTAAALKDAIEPFKALHAPLGIYFVMGNHEYFRDPRGWIETLRAMGIRVLQEEHVVLERDGQKLVVAGVVDPVVARWGFRVPDPFQTLAGAPEDSGKILLSHQPVLARMAQRAGFDAQLSGHTHAGQFFPFTLLIHFFQTYTSGLYDVDGLSLYVNRGAGFWGPPMRTKKGEVTLITLKAS
ncbi:MAG: metallophosphoesterase [Alphaproteobacteria bacterium]|nr:metallophosphoesterase [Alphaproteobacteria bacterium]